MKKENKFFILSKDYIFKKYKLLQKIIDYYIYNNFFIFYNIKLFFLNRLIMNNIFKKIFHTSLI